VRPVAAVVVLVSRLPAPVAALGSVKPATRVVARFGAATAGFVGRLGAAAAPVEVVELSPASAASVLESI
jgi:hypothetical protein